jgi:hypothetical protein
VDTGAGCFSTGMVWGICTSDIELVTEGGGGRAVLELAPPTVPSALETPFSVVLYFSRMASRWARRLARMSSTGGGVVASVNSTSSSGCGVGSGSVLGGEGLREVEPDRALLRDLVLP